MKQPPASGPGTHNWFKARSHDFGQKLRAWRKARSLRQLDACAVLGLPRDQGLICRYERREASPRRERMVLWHSRFGSYVWTRSEAEIDCRSSPQGERSESTVCSPSVPKTCGA